MNNRLMRNLVPFAAPLAFVGCQLINSALHGDVGGVISESHSIVNEAGQVDQQERAKNKDQVNISQEYYIGRGVSANVFQKYKPSQDAKLNEYVRLVGENVAKASRSIDIPDGKQPYKGYFFIVIEDTQVNAFSAPGGFIFVTTGAIRAMRTEDELACVLGHEIAHVVDRHGIKYVLDQKNNGVPFQVVGKVVGSRTNRLVGELAKGLADMCSDLANKVMSGMGRDYELAADKYGTMIAARAGYDPKCMPEFLKRTHHGENLK